MSKTVLITGASRGIGAQTARAFAQAGHRVVLNYHTSADKAEALAAELNGLAVQADVADSGQVHAMLQRAQQRFGGIDILINNAGISHFGLFDTLSEQDWNRLLAVHLSGAFHCIQGVLPHMLHQKSGCIVNVSSIWGITGASCEAAYSTAKAGLIGMTKALAKELGPSGIRVNCVAPGVVDTDMNAALSPEDLEVLKEETPLGSICSPDEIAKTILFLSRPDSFLTGQVISPNGGLVI